MQNFAFFLEEKINSNHTSVWRKEAEIFSEAINKQLLTHDYNQKLLKGLFISENAHFFAKILCDSLVNCLGFLYSFYKS